MLLFGVSGHVKRASNIARLVDRLRAQGVEPLVTLDEGDTARDAGNWETFSRAWMRHEASGAEWMLVLQDDTSICDDLVACCRWLVEQAPARFHMLSLFAHAAPRRPARAQLRYTRHLWGQGMLARVATVRSSIAWNESRQFSRPRRQDDIDTQEYFLAHRRPILLVLPNLVEHLPFPSLFNPDWPLERRSVWYAGDNANALEHAKRWSFRSIHDGRDRRLRGVL